jgi:hypothetical protein
MALLADDGEDRARQLLTLTERLTALVKAECVEIEARRPPAPDIAEERQKLAGLYRMEMARIAEDRARIAGVSPTLRLALQRATTGLMATLDVHARMVGALKEVSEGLVQAIATEISRVQASTAGYDSGGYRARASGPSAVAVNRSA